MSQVREPSLFDEPLPQLVDPPTTATPLHERPIQERFEAFHHANPWVAGELKRMALELVDAGHTRVGIGMLFEVVRWRSMRTTSDPSSSFRLNNSYRSRYARMLMDQEPELADVFETRQLTEDRG